MHTVSLDTIVNKRLFFFGLFCRFLLDFIIYYLKKSVYILLSLIIFQIVIFGGASDHFSFVWMSQYACKC